MTTTQQNPCLLSIGLKTFSIAVQLCLGDIQGHASHKDLVKDSEVLYTSAKVQSTIVKVQSTSSCSCS